MHYAKLSQPQRSALTLYYMRATETSWKNNQIATRPKWQPQRSIQVFTLNANNFFVLLLRSNGFLVWIAYLFCELFIFVHTNSNRPQNFTVKYKKLHHYRHIHLCSRHASWTFVLCFLQRFFLKWTLYVSHPNLTRQHLCNKININRLT